MEVIVIGAWEDQLSRWSPVILFTSVDSFSDLFLMVATAYD